MLSGTSQFPTQTAKTIAPMIRSERFTANLHRGKGAEGPLFEFHCGPNVVLTGADDGFEVPPTCDIVVMP